MPGIDDEYADLLRQYRDQPTPELRDRLHARYVALREAELLGGTTTSGLPYPDPSDPVAGGADAIRALAEALEPASASGWNARHISDTSTTQRAYFGTGDTASGAGHTYIGLSPVNGVDDGRSSALLLAVDGAVIWAIQKDGSVSSTLLAARQAAGKFTTNLIVSGAAENYTVTFPAGRFAYAPILTALAGSARAILSHANSATTTGTTIRIVATGGDIPAGTEIHWTATQFNTGSASG